MCFHQIHRFTLAAIAFVLFAGQALAQSYPNRVVHLVIPYAPGGGAELQARIVAHKLSEYWGRTVVLENKPGAGTTIGAAYASRAEPDGYTLYSAYASHVISASLYKNLPYDALKSFTPISHTQSAPFILVVPTSSKVRSVKDLVALAKASPGKLNYGSSGVGAGPHMATELFTDASDIKVLHVPYKGTGQVITAFLGGQMDFTIADPAIRPVVENGKARALAVTTSRRWSLMPDVPTMAEVGYPDVEITNWAVIMAPAGTPRPIVDQVNAALKKILQDKDLQKRFADNGYDIVGSSPEEAVAFLSREYQKYAKLVKKLGLRVE
jgi:tripartite-type tricarboxylate transporter receptor subunit TctC